MLEEYSIDLFLAIYAIFIAIMFAIMYLRKHLDFFWFFGPLLNAIANILFFLRHQNASYRILGNIFYFIAALALSISVIKEYISLRPKIKQSLRSIPKGKFPIIYLLFSSLIIIESIQIIFIIYTLILIVLLTKISVKEKSVTHAFMLLTIFAIFFTLLFSVLYNFNIEHMWEIAYIFKVIYLTSLLATSLSAPIEKLIQNSEKRYRASYQRVEFYKDLFAHDISNILQSVYTSIDLLTMNLKNTEKVYDSEFILNLMQSKVKDGANLISNTKILSEIEENIVPFKLLDFNLMIEEIISYLKEATRHLNVQINAHLQKDLPLIKGNKYLKDMFKNIIDNGIRHNVNEIKEIDIYTLIIEKDDLKYLRVEIVDNGIGFQDEIKQKLNRYDIYSQKSTLRIGLGLLLIRRILKDHNGQFWVENRNPEDYTQGSKFIILIPLKYHNRFNNQKGKK